MRKTGNQTKLQLFRTRLQLPVVVSEINCDCQLPVLAMAYRSGCRLITTSLMVTGCKITRTTYTKGLVDRTGHKLHLDHFIHFIPGDKFLVLCEKFLKFI